MTTHAASAAILKLLRTSSGRATWVNTISDGMGTDFNRADLSEEFKTTLGRNMLARAEKIAYTADRERRNILLNIARAYDVTEDEKNSISRQLADTPRTDLKNYRTVAGRAKFL